MPRWFITALPAFITTTFWPAACNLAQIRWLWSQGLENTSPLPPKWSATATSRSDLYLDLLCTQKYASSTVGKWSRLRSVVVIVGISWVILLVCGQLTLIIVGGEEKQKNKNKIKKQGLVPSEPIYLPVQHFIFYFHTHCNTSKLWYSCMCPKPHPALLITEMGKPLMWLVLGSYIIIIIIIVINFFFLKNSVSLNFNFSFL